MLLGILIGLILGIVLKDKIILIKDKILNKLHLK